MSYSGIQQIPQRLVFVAQVGLLPTHFSEPNPSRTVDKWFHAS